MLYFYSKQQIGAIASNLLGKIVSVIAGDFDQRYEGILHSVDIANSTFVLRNGEFNVELFVWPID